MHHSLRFALVLLSITVAVAGGCNRKPARQSNTASPAPAETTPSEIAFSDVTDDSNVHAVYRNGEEANEMSIVESLGGGVAMLDYDLDGRQDLFFPTGGRLPAGKPLPGLPNQLYRNLGGFHFAETSSAAAVADSRTYSHGCAAADFDGDGFTDIVVTGYEGLQLFRNRGDGTFADQTEVAGLDDDLWSSSAGWGDFNGDGHPDLYVTHYVNWSWDHHPKCAQRVPGGFDICAPSDFQGLPDVIYMNQGDGTFQPARDEVGLRDDGKGLGVIIADWNLDAHVDVYVANDTTNNFLYVNDGQGQFSEEGLVTGVAVDGHGVANGSMGLAVVDIENDLRPDLWVTNYENETFGLYQNSGNGNFLWASERAGVNALGTLFVGFGTTAGDFDLDGDEDLVVANGHVMRFPVRATVAQQPLLLANITRGGAESRDGRLVRQRFPDDDYFSRPWRGRGVVKGDLDGDGRLDLVFTNVEQPAAILANVSETSGRPLAIRLVGTRCNRDAIGAYAVLETDQSKYARMVVGGGSYLSQDPYTLTWAIPRGETFRQLTIRWPDGSQQRIDELPKGDPAVIVQRDP